MTKAQQAAVYIALGANLPSHLGGPQVTLPAAIKAIAEHPDIEVTARSSLYRSVAVPASDQPDFVNAVIAGQTSLPPEDLLEVLHEIEKSFGRQRDVRWEARILDLDLLDWDGTVVDPGPIPHDQTTRPLALPHPAMADRPFVLVPLMEIAPDWRHPVLGGKVGHLLERLPKPWNTDRF